MYPSRMAMEVLQSIKQGLLEHQERRKHNGKSNNMGKYNRLPFYSRGFKTITDEWNKNYTGIKNWSSSKLKTSVYQKTLSTE